MLTAALGKGICNECLTAQQAKRETEQAARKEAEKHELDSQTTDLNELHLSELADIGPILIRRYSDAYIYSHTVVAVGKTIKGLGVFLTIIVAIGGLVVASNESAPTFFVVGLLLACVVGMPIYIAGILVAAVGQIVLATLDSAVNTSRHLKDAEVARILCKRW